VHRLCRLGGLIVIVRQAFKGNGYYTFDVSFFEGLAAANDYRVLFASYIVTMPDGQQFNVPAASPCSPPSMGPEWRAWGSRMWFKIHERDFMIPY
jgi:hypothetical protein